MIRKEMEYLTNYKSVTIKTTDGSTIQGKVNVTPNSRVSDLFNVEPTTFIIVVDASSHDASGKTFFINKQHIVVL